MFPFKVQLFQGCKSETEPINRKSVRATCYTIPSIVGDILQSRYQVLLATYCKADTKYCCCRATRLSGHIVDFTTHTHTHQPFVYDTKYCWRHITKRFEFNTVCKSFERCKNG
jgi:hypothetical protein